MLYLAIIMCHACLLVFVKYILREFPKGLIYSSINNMFVLLNIISISFNLIFSSKSINKIQFMENKIQSLHKKFSNVYSHSPFRKKKKKVLNEIWFLKTHDTCFKTTSFSTTLARPVFSSLNTCSYEGLECML